MISKNFFTVFILLMLPWSALAQVDSTATDSLAAPLDSLIVAPVDTLSASFRDTLSAESKPLVTVQPWIYHRPLNAHITATDSTLRWNIWPSWVYKKNRDPGVISFRMGSIGRTNTFSVFAHQPKYLELYWGDIRMNDPVTGIVNWNGMPLHKVSRIYEEDTGLAYRTTFHLKEYHLIKPLTKLIYSESKFDFRNLEFMLSRNFGRKTNAEASYWYRAGGGEYKNSSINGHQIYARVSHQLNQQQKLKFTILSNGYNNSQPFGYFISDMQLFAFNRFATSANQSNAESERSSTIFALDYNRRPPNTTNAAGNLHAGLFTRTAERRVKFSSDTTYYKVREFGVNLKKWLHAGPFALSGDASFNYFMNDDSQASSLNTNNWSLFKIGGEAVFQPFSLIELSIDGAFTKRGEQQQYLLGAGASVSLFNAAKLSAGYSTGTRMPTVQQLYWQSAGAKGNANLLNEEITEMHVQLGLDIFNNTSIGIRTQLKQVDNGIMLVDSTFTNINHFGSFSATAWFNYVGSLFEFYGSATLHQYGNFLQDASPPFPLSEQERIWFKAGAYVKGYLFDRATYVKAGFSGIFSPRPYQAAHYFTPLDFWQPKSNDSFIPAFHRLDFDLSARVRTIMITLRYENILDNLFQYGYFETANYPMNRRRLIFGIKVFFRN